jgi:quinolinate synthase
MEQVKKRPNTREDYLEEIARLKKEKNAVILAHYYQEPDIQDVADFVGDSLGLSRQAATTDADVIVFAGVHFMAETAKIINPNKKVLLPDLDAGCSLADSAPLDKFQEFVDAHPDHLVVTYINCSAEIKALSDIICTSSNAIDIINSIPKDQKIICAPDRNLGAYLNQQTGRDMLLWDGACLVHEAFAMDKILDLYKSHPNAKFIAHPESQQEVLRVASFVGSTEALLNHVVKEEAMEFIVATEAGILHEMQKRVPNKQLIPAPSKADNSCACSECHFMKMNTLEKLYLCLNNETPEIDVPEDIRRKALVPLERMLELSK